MARECTIRWGKELDFTSAVLTERGRITDETYSYGLYMILEAKAYDTAYAAQRKAQGLYTRGTKNLIYIGIVKSAERSFFQRMEEHRKDWLHAINRRQIWVKFGIVHYDAGIRDVGQLIEDAESALVFEYQPRENTSKMKSYTIGEDLVVRNINGAPYIRPRIETVRHTG